MELKFTREALNTVIDKIERREIEYVKVWKNISSDEYFIDFEERTIGQIKILAKDKLYNTVLLQLDNLYFLNLVDEVNEFYLEVDFKNNIFNIKASYKNNPSGVNKLSTIRNKIFEAKELVNMYSIRDLTINGLYKKSNLTEKKATLLDTLDKILKELHYND